jgi:hypothetical protein
MWEAGMTVDSTTSLAIFSRFVARIESADLRAVALHWNQVRKNRLMPAWRDINAMEIRHQLPMVWAYRYDRGTDSFTGRLAGEEIERLFGKTFRGRPMRELFPASEFEEMFRRHKRIVSEPALFHGSGFVFRHLGREGIGERIIMPLADDGIHCDGILGTTRYVFPSAEQLERPPSRDGSAEKEEFLPLI